MNPIYKFELSANGTTQRAFPTYKDDLAKDFEKESGQQFFRAKLSGNLTFESHDYTFIVSKAFDTQFALVIFISYDAAQSWTPYWRGTFWKTDCKFNEDDQTVTVTPTVNDQYNALLAGLDKEYNLIDLAPVIQPVKLDKRPMIQVYVPGQTVIGCFLSGMWWEQECEAVSEYDTVDIGGHAYPALQYKYHFSLNKKTRILDVTQTGAPVLPNFAMGVPSGTGLFDITKDNYRFRAYFDTTDPDDQFYMWEIIRVSDNTLLWSYKSYSISPTTPYSVTLTAVNGTGATGTVELYVHDIAVYSRYVVDVAEALGVPTYPIGDDDMVGNNRNYHYVIGYYYPDTIFFNDALSASPTQWGLYQPGQYYVQYTNPVLGVSETFPVARSSWGRISIWFAFDTFDWITEEYWRKEFTLKDAFPLWSVISVLLAKIAPGITHAGTVEYSKFLYGVNPISAIDQRLLITPKSNLIASGYDQPAQKATITLKNVLDMLRDCFRCYWFVDAQNKLRIEHISYFMNGGAYPGTPDYPVVGIDLTQQIVTSNGKPWAYARNQYEFDKPEMASRYQFGWMDDVTQLFEGYPIDIISKYVNPDNIEQIDVSQFTSDVDYILLNPDSISKDGFVLLGAAEKSQEAEGYTTPGVNFSVSVNISVPANMDVVVTVDGAGLVQGDAFALNVGNVSFPITAGVPLTVNAPFDIATLQVTCAAASVLSAGTVTLKASVPDDLALPYVNFEINSSNHILQNAWVAFVFLQQYYMFDMPARNVEINGVPQIVQGIKKLKAQTIKFPALTDPDLFNLIKTELGNGTIQKISVNLSSRNANATLKYDTE